MFAPRETLVRGIIGPMMTLSTDQVTFLADEITRLGLDDVMSVQRHSDFFMSAGHVVADWKGPTHEVTAGNFAFAEKVAMLFGAPEVSDTNFGGYFDVMNITRTQQAIRVRVIGNETFCLKDVPMFEQDDEFFVDISEADEHPSTLVIPHRFLNK